MADRFAVEVEVTQLNRARIWDFVAELAEWARVYVDGIEGEHAKPTFKSSTVENVSVERADLASLRAAIEEKRLTLQGIYCAWTVWAPKTYNGLSLDIDVWLPDEESMISPSVDISLRGPSRGPLIDFLPKVEHALKRLARMSKWKNITWSVAPIEVRTTDDGTDPAPTHPAPQFKRSANAPEYKPSSNRREWALLHVVLPIVIGLFVTVGGGIALALLGFGPN